MSTTFVTGGTGVVGSEIVRDLLERGTDRLVLLMRAASVLDAQARLEALRTSWGLPPGAFDGRVEAIVGDTSLPSFGVDPQRLAAIAEDVTRIIHCAALVRMNLPIEEARASALGATRNVIELARAAGRGGALRKVEFVSTVGVGGLLPGVLPEHFITAPRDFHNTYEQAKAEAEVLVEGAVADGLPITVHRPSMVVGHSQTGRVRQFQIFYHLVEFLSGRRTRGLFPSLGNTRLDVVPVDHVAHAIVWSSTTTDTVGRVMHLCTGPEASPRLDALRARVRAAYRAAGIRVPAAITLPSRMVTMALPVVSALLPRERRRALATLPIFLAYLAGSEGFANAETRRTLAGAGIALPLPDAYLDRVLAAYLDTKRAPA